MSHMKRAALAGEDMPEIRLLAERIIKDVMARDYLSEYAAIYHWVASHIRYTRDPRTIEQVKEPHVTLATGQGDCDDMATLIAALVLSVGGHVRFVAGSFGKGRPLTHVWAEAYAPANKAWVILDPVPGDRISSLIKNTRTRVELLVQ